MAVELLHKRNSSTGAVPSTSALALGEIAINTYDGKLFIKTNDGTTDSIVEFTSGTSPLSVAEIDSQNSIVSSTNVSAVTQLAFDQDSGFDITNLGNGTVKVGMNSTFKYWEVDGQDTITATGLDHIELVAGNGIILTTDVNASPYQTLTIETPPKTVQLFQDGVLENTTGTVRWYAPGNVTVNDIAARISTTSNVNVQISVKKTGSGAESLTLNSGDTKVTKSTNFTMGTDDYLTVDIVCTNNTTGRGLSVEFFYTFD